MAPRAGKTGLVPTAPPLWDLTQVTLGPLNGKDIADVAAATLRAGESLLAHWTELEPIVKKLTEIVRAQVESGVDDPRLSPMVMLSTIAGVVEKITRASGSVMKASEGLGRLTVLVMGGVRQRPDTAQLSEKQLAGIVIEAARRMKDETGVCPICAPPILDVTA